MSGISTQTIVLVLIVLIVIYLYIDQKGKKKAPASEQKKYPAVRAVAFLTEILAFTVLVVAAIIALSMFSNVNTQNGWVVPAAVLGIGVVLFIVFLAQAQMLRVFLDIEENTRKGAWTKKDDHVANQ